MYRQYRPPVLGNEENKTHHKNKKYEEKWDTFKRKVKSKPSAVMKKKPNSTISSNKFIDTIIPEDKSWISTFQRLKSIDHNRRDKQGSPLLPPTERRIKSPAVVLRKQRNRRIIFGSKEENHMGVEVTIKSEILGFSCFICLYKQN